MLIYHVWSTSYVKFEIGLVRQVHLQKCCCKCSLSILLQDPDEMARSALSEDQRKRRVVLKRANIERIQVRYAASGMGVGIVPLPANFWSILYSTDVCCYFVLIFVFVGLLFLAPYGPSSISYGLKCSLKGSRENVFCAGPEYSAGNFQWQGQCSHFFQLATGNRSSSQLQSPQGIFKCTNLGAQATCEADFMLQISSTGQIMAYSNSWPLELARRKYLKQDGLQASNQLTPRLSFPTVTFV